MAFWTLSRVEHFWHIKQILGKGDESLLIEKGLIAPEQVWLFNFFSFWT